MEYDKKYYADKSIPLGGIEPSRLSFSYPKCKSKKERGMGPVSGFHSVFLPFVFPKKREAKISSQKLIEKSQI